MDKVFKRTTGPSKQKPGETNVYCNRQYTIGSFRALEDDDTGRTFELTFSSEEPYDRWWGTEILDHSDGAIDLVRLKEMGVVLFNHNRDYILGKILEVNIKDRRGSAKIQFDTDDEAEKIFQKVHSGTLKGVSVGYTVSNYEEVMAGKKSADGRFQGPCWIAKKWTPLEISIVSVPADASVGVGRDFEDIPPSLSHFNAREESKSSSISVADAAMQITKNFLLN